MYLQISGIDRILPCMKIDDYLFEPCGYSMNGILKNESIDFGLVGFLKRLKTRLKIASVLTRVNKSVSS
jgi:hypothetical protein